jgi:hypothetical protein
LVVLAYWVCAEPGGEVTNLERSGVGAKVC